MIGMTTSSKQQKTPSGRVPEWTLGWRLQRALAEAGIGVQQMADELQRSRSTLSRWFSDQGKPPPLLYLRHWAERCAVDEHWLITGRRGETPEPDAVSNFGWKRYSGSEPSPIGRLAPRLAQSGYSERAA
jgi:transcriptional regulator with XRE-family HTH domain